MTSQLTQRTLRGLFWSLLERGGSQLIQLAITVVLARILLPRDFGLIAILNVFIAVSNRLVDAGFGQALIHQQNATHTDECSVFYFNIVFSAVLAAALFLASPLIADFYDNAVLLPIGRVLSINILVSAFGAVHFTILTKHLDFKTQMNVSLASLIISGVIGIAAALEGAGVWSLVAQSVSASVVRTILVWRFHTWRPAWALDIHSLRRMFPFGSRLLFSSLLGTVSDNLFALVIGKVYSAKDLGYFSRADQLQRLPIANFSAAVGRITFPAFSSVQDDKPRLKRGVRKAVMALAMISFPMMIGLAIVAKPLVILLFTDKWLSSVPFLQLMCLSGMLFPLHAANLNVLKAQGRSDLFLRLEIIKRVLQALALMLTYRFGIMAMLYGAVIVSWFGYYINVHYTRELIGYSFLEQMRDIVPSAVTACLMAVCIYPLHFVIESNQLVLLLIQVVLGVTLYGVFGKLFASRSFSLALQILNSRRFAKDGAE